MSNYVKSTNFTAKDSLPTGDANKVIRGSEFDTEFNALVVAVATKSDLSAPTFTGEATFADLTATGTVNFSSATVSNLGAVTTADINGGTIDGVTIGGSSAGAGTFSSLVATTADINGGTVDNATIGGTTPAAGTFSSLTATTANIDGGSIDGTVIGGATPAAVSGTTGTFSGAVSGTTGTFSGAVTGSNLNIANWDTAYGWGDHSTQGYLTSVAFTDIDAGAVTLSSETFSDVDNQIPTNAAVVDYVAATIPLISEVNDLSTVVTWATVPDAFISASSVNQHVSVEKATQTKTYTNGETFTITLSSAVSSGAPVVSVTKEVPQTGVTNNTWDVNSTTENYTRLNSAPATTLDFVNGDLSGSTFVNSFSVSSQEIQPSGVAFNTDGTKMFVVGENSDEVQEYALSTGFDVSTASHTRSFSVASQEIQPSGIAFNSDGTKMFISGENGEDVNEYSVSTGFDLSSVSFTQNFSVSSQDTDPRDVAFSTDGTSMFILGRDNDTVFQYTLTTGFDLSTASYASKSFSVASQEDNPKCFGFNSDGTKMFVIGWTNDTVFEYALSTAFDVSTASYSSVSFSIASQETAPDGIAFNNEDSKMFVCGQSGDSIYEYNLGSSISLGTGSFASADVGKTIEANSGVFVLTATDGSFSQITAPTSYAQVASGSWEMYAVVYNTTDGDLELSAKTNPYDISGSSLVQSFSVSSEDDRPHDVKFNNDGTKMFIVGQTGEEVNEYNLTTAYDISTASYSQRLSTTTQETSPTGVAFNTDGTRLFLVGNNGDAVDQYNLSTGFDLSTASASTNFSVSAQDTQPEGITFNTDGSKMYIVGGFTDTIYEYDLSTNFDLSTASYSSRSLSVSSEHNFPSGMAFNSDGTKMFVVGAAVDKVSEYALTTAFDISTASFNSVQFSIENEATPESLTFNNDGTKMFIVGSTGDKVYEYTSTSVNAPSGYHAAHTTTSTDSTFWTDINSMTADEAAGDGAVYYAVSTDDRTTWKIAKGTDGERSIVRNDSGTWQYNSNGTYGSTTWANAATNTELAALQEAMEGATGVTGFSITNASYDSKTFDPVSQETNPRDVAFNSDGTKMYVIGLGADTVFQYSLSTAYDVSTASYDSVSFSVSSQDTSPSGLVFNGDGTKMFVSGYTNDSVYEYGLTTGFDLSTASYTQAFSVATQTLNPYALRFNGNGTKMFIVEAASELILEYALTTGFDVSTASYTRNFDVTSELQNANGLAFNNDGTKMLVGGTVIGTSTQIVAEYTLTTGFDVSTASYSSNTFTPQATPQALTFNADGTKMYHVDNDGVFQYSTSTTSYPNQMNKTQLDAVPDANHFTLGDDLDLAIIFNFSSGSTAPSSDGVSINYDANTLNQGAVLGTDYNWDFPATDKVRLTSLGDYNLKVRII